MPCPPPGDLPDPGTEPRSPEWQADSLSSEPPGKPPKFLEFTFISAVAAAKSLQSCPTLCDHMDGSPPGSPSLGFSRQEHWSGLPCPPPGDLPNLWIESRSPTLQVDFLPSESPGKPKNTGVGSLSFLQGIFLTQESNQGLRHCRWIFYQLSYQGSPYRPYVIIFFPKS